MRYYVYELIDPRDDSVFYVGKGQKGRVDQHETEARKGRQSRKCRRIREIEAEGLRIKKRKVSHHNDEIEAYDAEVERIAFYGLENLTNVLAGGGGKVPDRGPTLYQDTIMVKRIAPLVRRSHGVEAIILFGKHRIEIEPIREMMAETLSKIAARRSLSWVNEVLAGHKVELVLN